MFGRFGRDAGSLAGVQITQDSVRMLRLGGARGRRKVAGWAHRAVPPAGHPDQAGEGLVQVLREAHRQCGGRSTRVALALPGSQVICKVVQLPAELSPVERESQLLADAEHLFPFPLDDLAMDFQVLGATVHAPSTVDVLIGAVRQSLLEPLLLPLEEAGLDVVAVEVDSLALARLQPSGPRLPVLQLESHGMILHQWDAGPLALRTEQRVEARSDLAVPPEQVQRFLARSPMAQESQALGVAGAAATEAQLQALAQQLGRACRPLCGPSQWPGLPASAWGALALPLALALGGDS
ncbi:MULTISPECIES: type IV pilus biogenesis protein PilM [unclassified Pseudomonas]|uniref:type IV pilus biogenesis protein PilM n=1 Tax=unclassified Pseudomonas TaxID=196821 RepID=UPI0022795B2D|nr:MULTISPECIES: pilus assembly protein PilM [unclassified Pseudomonas]